MRFNITSHHHIRIGENNNLPVRLCIRLGSLCMIYHTLLSVTKFAKRVAIEREKRYILIQETRVERSRARRCNF